MWKNGTFIIDDVMYSYQALVFDEKSRFGIRGGRISKLIIWRGGIHDFKNVNESVMNYDRGWDICPRNKSERMAMEYVLTLYI